MNKVNIFPICIECRTYNQSEYIEDALNGFTMQKTSFPFLCIVMDDASTDGEPKVISSFLEKFFFIDQEQSKETDDYILTFAQHKNNLNCYFAVYYLKYNHYHDFQLNKKKDEYIAEWENCTNYLAICEGDDYWIDALKLQKQVDYMEAHKDVSYLFTGRIIEYENQGYKIIQTYKDRVYTTLDILSGFNPGLQNMIARNAANLKTAIKGVNGDRLLPLFCSMNGNIRCINDITSVYRFSGKGVSTSISEENSFEHATNDFIFFHKKFDFPSKSAFLKGEARYFGPYLRKRGVRKGYKAFRKIIVSGYPDMCIVDFLKLLYLTFTSKIKKELKISDVKEKIIK